MKLISFNTTQNENAAMQYIEQYVKEKYGDAVVCKHQAIGDNNRYNLIIKNTDQPDIILAGHVDTVPELSKEQFIPKIEGNTLYGR
jgi:acetylornithine deacetylase/succinyl-diaminopimelate desuccinylase-like protein